MGIIVTEKPTDDADVEMAKDDDTYTEEDMRNDMWWMYVGLLVLFTRVIILVIWIHMLLTNPRDMSTNERTITEKIITVDITLTTMCCIATIMYFMGTLINRVHTRASIEQ